MDCTACFWSSSAVLRSRKVIVFDVLVHKDIFPRQQPELNIYRTAGVFGSEPGNRREIDRLDLRESILPLGHGLARFRSADALTHQDTIQFACEQRGRNANELRGYRCRIEYPMYSSEIELSFALRPT